MISHRFLQYRGFTCEYFVTGVKQMDIVDPLLYPDRNDRELRKFRTMGSSCTYEDVATITAIWDKKSYNLISNNNIIFRGYG